MEPIETPRSRGRPRIYNSTELVEKRRQYQREYYAKQKEKLTNEEIERRRQYQREAYARKKEAMLKATE